MPTRKRTTTATHVDKSVQLHNVTVNMTDAPRMEALTAMAHAAKANADALAVIAKGLADISPIGINIAPVAD